MEKENKAAGSGWQKGAGDRAESVRDDLERRGMLLRNSSRKENGGA